MSNWRGRSFRSRIAMHALLCMIAAVAVSGCGPLPEKGVTVKGKLVYNGKPLHMENPEVGVGYVVMDLIPPNEEEAWAGDIVDTATGEFVFLGRDDKYGIPPGTYKLAIEYYPSGMEEHFGGELSEDNSGIEIVIPADKVGGEHDLGTIELGDHVSK